MQSLIQDVRYAVAMMAANGINTVRIPHTTQSTCSTSPPNTICAQKRYLDHGKAGIKARDRMALIEGYYTLVVGMTTALGMSAVLWIGVHHIESGLLSVATYCWLSPTLDSSTLR